MSFIYTRFRCTTYGTAIFATMPKRGIAFTAIQCRDVSNKRITRLQSDIQIEDSEHPPRLINRNPRNLEQSSFAMKPNGFWLDRAPPLHWNKIVFEPKGKYLEASLLQWNGKALLTASTRERALAKYLKSTNTAEASVTLAQVFARRCLQSGYLYAVPEQVQDNVISHNRKAFYESLEKAGLCLEEPPQIVPRTTSDN